MHARVFPSTYTWNCARAYHIARLYARSCNVVVSMKKIRLERKELPANHVARSCFLFFHFSFSLPSPPMWLSTRKTLLPLDSDSRRIFSLLLSHLLVLSFADLTPHFVRSRLSRACLEPDRGPGFSLTYRSDVAAVYTTTEIPCFHTKKQSKCVKPTRLQKAKEKWSRRRTNVYSLSRSLSRVTYVCTYICTYVLHVVIEIYFYLSQTPLILSPQVTHASRCYQPFSIDASQLRETITGYNIDLSMSSIIRESSRFPVLYETVTIVRRKISFRRDFSPYFDFVRSFWTCTDFARIQFATTSRCCITTIDRTMPMEFNATRSNDIAVHRSFLTTLCTFTTIGSRSPRYPSIVLQTIAHRFLKGKHARCAKSLAFCRYSYFDCLCTCLYTYVCVCMYISLRTSTRAFVG